MGVPQNGRFIMENLIETIFFGGAYLGNPWFAEDDLLLFVSEGVPEPQIQVVGRIWTGILRFRYISRIYCHFMGLNDQ